VEFQPDLQNPTAPVKLGCVLYEQSPTGQHSLVIIGRMPRPTNRPPEFQHVSDMTMELAADWVEAMAKDIMEGKPADPIAHLASRWHWNLYVVEPEATIIGDRENLTEAAARLYEAFVGEPTRERAGMSASRRRRATTASVPSRQEMLPWELEDVTLNRRETLIEAYA
jgi:hypothetical protein